MKNKTLIKRFVYMTKFTRINFSHLKVFITMDYNQMVDLVDFNRVLILTSM